LYMSQYYAYPVHILFHGYKNCIVVGFCDFPVVEILGQGKFP